MRLALVLSCLFYFVAVLMQMKACNGCIEKERMGLLEMKANFVALFGDVVESEFVSWVDDRDSNCCSWNRVKCANVSTGHVTELSLETLDGMLFSVEPTFPNMTLNFSLFSPFKELVSLDLSGNTFNNWIHNQGFSRLQKLEALDLSCNYLNTSVLLNLKGLTSLRTLMLGANSMYGSFPTEDIQKMQRLKVLDLMNNNLNGSIGEIEKMQSLKVLDLSGNNLNGSIEGLCKISDLLELSLTYNMFSGQIPNCLSNQRNLQVLDLSQNMFSGNFPSFISNITSLVYLSLVDNFLQGSFSLSTLANHSKLQVLYISSQSPRVHVETENAQWFPSFQLKSLILESCNLNMDEGSIVPSFLKYQKALQYINLSHNKLVGAFPSWLIQNNSRIKYFFARNNSFVGNLYFSVTNNIVQLDISNNNVSGPLPKDIGHLFPRIRILNLSMNNFGGSIPASVGMMQDLNWLDLSHNCFSGELPENLGHISLEKLKLSHNLLHGNIPRFFNPTQELFLNNNNLNCTLRELLGNLEAGGLAMLDISNNLISGEIPSSIAKLSSVTILLMAKNQLEGKIPAEFFNLSELVAVDLSQNRLSGCISHVNPSNLLFLYLQKNAFSGSIPTTLSKGSSLSTLDLRDNNFSGNIPYWMGTLSNLRLLLLGGNNFIGHIPIQLCQLQYINIMDLSRNKIKGSIPSCFNNLSFGLEENGYSNEQSEEELSDTSLLSLNSISTVSLFWPSVYIYVGTKSIVEFRTKNNIYSYSGNILEKMTGMDLSCNMLVGSIPFQIGNLDQIRALNLSHNYLSGAIPNTFSNLTQIESLDLSFNNLSGEIPFQLTKLNFLAIFNVSYNNLSGIPPSTGQFGDFDEENYKCNPYLCGPLLNRKCEGSPPSHFNGTIGKETTIDTVAFYWSFIASYITILLGFTTVLWINAYWRMAWFYFIGKIINKCFPNLPLY